MNRCKIPILKRSLDEELTREYAAPHRLPTGRMTMHMGKTGNIMGLLGALLLSIAALPCMAQEPQPGATDTAAYLPLLRGKRVALLCNHTSTVGAEHLVDLLCRRSIRPVLIFSPEHGFRGSTGAGESVKSSVDEATSIPIRSLYDGRTKRPSVEAISSFDILVADLQDVGLRFYTYHIALLRMMDACAEAGKEVIVLDRPNPNGHYIDGPLLDMRYASGVGAIPVPVVHGMTMGEIARMAIGEGWAQPCRLTVIPCLDYDHNTRYTLPVAPSPNLRTQHAVYLYPSTCLFEGTVVSLGRGTPWPFEVYGHPLLKGKEFGFVFTPRADAGASHPALEGQTCYGRDLRDLPEQFIWEHGVDLSYVIDAYHALKMGDEFFTPMFEKLIGAGYVRRMIEQGRTAAEIRAVWRQDVERFRRQRRPYLLYAE